MKCNSLSDNGKFEGQFKKNHNKKVKRKKLNKKKRNFKSNKKNSRN